MITETDMRTARITKWGFAGLLLFAAAMFSYAHRDDRMLMGDIALCAISGGLGFALLLERWWARWLALGLCFVMIMAAAVLPVLRFLLQPEGTSQGAVLANSLFTVFLLALGGIAYRALSYYRSQLGRREYAGNPERETRLESEGSLAVIGSACAWLLVFAGIGYLGTSLPTTLIATRDAERDAQRELAARRDADAARQPEIRAAEAGPDLVPVGLCRGGDTLVVLAYENRGITSRVREFEITYTDKWWDPRSWARAPAKLPPPGGVGVVALGLIGSMGGEDDHLARVLVSLDAGNDIQESDESNNDPEYALSWNSFMNLPTCDTVQNAQR